MVPFLDGFLRWFLSSGPVLEPGGDGGAHPVRIARGGFQLVVLHLSFRQRLCIGQLAPCQQPPVRHRTPPVVLVIDDGKRRVIRRLRVGAYIHGPLGGIVAVNAVRPKLCVFDRRMIQASVVIHPAVKILLRPFQTVPIAAPVVIPLALFPFGKLPGHKGVRRARIMPQRKAVSAVKGGGFQNGIALYSFQMVPPFCASGQHGPKLCMLRNAGKNRGGMDCSIPAPETTPKKP